jgi:uncharacterized protein YndB with AHSA1/START domain
MKHPGTFQTSRAYLYPVSKIFNAFSDPIKLSKWWGPAGFRNEFEVFEFRIGGEWNFKMVSSEGKAYPNESVFADIIENKKIVIQHTNQPHFVLAIELVQIEQGAQVLWTQTFKDLEVAKMMEPIVTKANEENLDRLGLCLRNL